MNPLNHDKWIIFVILVVPTLKCRCFRKIPSKRMEELKSFLCKFLPKMWRSWHSSKYTPYCSFHGNDLRGEIPVSTDLPHNHLAIWKLRPCGIQSLRRPDHLQRVINNFLIVLLGRKISLVIFFVFACRSYGYRLMYTTKSITLSK